MEFKLGRNKIGGGDGMVQRFGYRPESYKWFHPPCQDILYNIFRDIVLPLSEFHWWLVHCKSPAWDCNEREPREPFLRLQCKSQALGWEKAQRETNVLKLEQEKESLEIVFKY